jgi:hypothetical protein
VVDEHMRRYYDQRELLASRGARRVGGAHSRALLHDMYAKGRWSQAGRGSAPGAGVPVLNDGSRHTVYKRFFVREELAAELGGSRVLHAGRWFVAVAAKAC